MKACLTTFFQFPVPSVAALLIISNSFTQMCAACVPPQDIVPFSSAIVKVFSTTGVILPFLRLMITEEFERTAKSTQSGSIMRGVSVVSKIESLYARMTTHIYNLRVVCVCVCLIWVYVFLRSMYVMILQILQSCT